MNANGNTPNEEEIGKQSLTRMSESTGESNHKCKFCGGKEGLTFAVVADSDAEIIDFDDDKTLWLCQEHYSKLVKTEEYRVRELPDEDFELGHSTREEIVEDDGEEYVTILKPNHEEAWLKYPDFLETDLQDEQ